MDSATPAEPAHRELRLLSFELNNGPGFAFLAIEEWLESLPVLDRVVPTVGQQLSPIRISHESGQLVQFRRLVRQIVAGRASADNMKPVLRPEPTWDSPDEAPSSGADPARPSIQTQSAGCGRKADVAHEGVTRVRARRLRRWRLRPLFSGQARECWLLDSCRRRAGRRVRPSARAGEPEMVRIRWMTATSSIVATSCIRPAQCEQRRTSGSKVRRISAAHVQ
jgi:hypothetical protein